METEKDTKRLNAPIAAPKADKATFADAMCYLMALPKAQLDKAVQAALI